MDRDARLTELEIALAHQERQGEELTTWSEPRPTGWPQWSGGSPTSLKGWPRSRPAAPRSRRLTPGRRTGEAGGNAVSACP